MILRVSKLACLASVLLLTACGDDSGSTGDETSTGADATDTQSTDTQSTGETSGTGDATAGDGDAGDGDAGDGDAGDGDAGDGDSGDGDGDGDIPPCPYDEVTGDPGFSWEQVAGGFNRPVGVFAHPTVPDRLYVIEQFTGNIKIIEPGETSPPDDSLLTISVNSNQSELGLLGLAFHPNFPEDPRFYVNYNPPGALRTRISEFTVTSDPDVADPASERILMEIDQPYWNHDGGGLVFGPDDGYLYIALGDGGSGGDPDNNGQDPSTLLGSILRVDVEPSGNLEYTIPSDNPFVGMSGFREEIWAWGMRNPFRISFDTDGTLYAGDVGQDAYEEIDVIEKGGNYGWNDMEGFECYNNGCDDSVSTPNTANGDGQITPIWAQGHNTGIFSITGGHVYRSCEVPEWQGRYVFGDLSGVVFQLEWDGTSANNVSENGSAPGSIVSFGGNAWGDVYMAAFTGQTTGNIYRLTPN